MQDAPLELEIVVGIEEVLNPIIKFFAGVGGLTLALLLLWIFYPEKVEKWAILLHKLLAYVSDRHERQFIAKNIEHGVREWKEGLVKESKDILPYNIRIKWIDVDKVEHDLTEGTLIVKMRNHRNQSRNLALAAREYIPNALIPTAKRYVDPSIMNCVVYVVSKSLLSRNTSALSYFIEMAKDDIKHEQKTVLEEIEQIDAMGYLTRVLLPQYAKLSVLHPADPTPEVRDETLGFERKVHQLVIKKPGEDVNPTFNGLHIHAAIVPIARSEKLFLAGITAHLHFIKESIAKGIETFYIVSVSGLKSYAKDVVEKSLTNYGLRKVWEDEYFGTFRKRRQGLYCAMLSKD